MLDQEIRQRIQSAYKQLLESRALKPRFGQRKMIAEIANCLATVADDQNEPPVCVVEAGTGTGKTLAYLLAVLPLASALNKKVVLATATIALQEQIVSKDIPEILAGCDLDFSYSLAKGRGRYLCLSRLDTLLRGNDSAQAMMDLYGEEFLASDEDDRVLYQSMLDELSAGTWDGDKDAWKGVLREAAWKPVTVDNSQCMGPKCSNFRSCCFYQARESMLKADCIVTNHDLVLSDLALGGGVILPDPENTIYIFDEAHHLPLKSNNHFSAFTRVRSTIQWLQRCQTALSQLAKDGLLGQRKQVLLSELDETISGTLSASNQVWDLLEQLTDSLELEASYDNRSQHTFKMGLIPAEIQQQASVLAKQFARLASGLGELIDRLKVLMEEGEGITQRQQAEQWFPVIGGQARRAEGNLALWLSFAQVDAKVGAPFARWLSISEVNNSLDIALSSSPILAAENLQQRLWQICSGAVLTSATLSALGNFDMLKMRAGLPDHTHFLRIASPFDYAKAATLSVPKLNCEPGNVDKHTAAIIRILPQVVGPREAALMLFSSRRQMLDVLQGLPTEWAALILCQDDYQKSQLLNYHRQRVDKGEGSIIFGLASFAEGVDLPGKYCTHVLIAKIPFAVPNDPIESTLAQWIEAQGMNSFMTLAVPDAAFKLVQASGRLLRSETDTGKITLFDERLISKRYGKSILESLPPYSREIFTQDLS